MLIELNISEKESFYKDLRNYKIKVSKNTGELLFSNNNSIVKHFNDNNSDLYQIVTLSRVNNVYKYNVSKIFLLNLKKDIFVTNYDMLVNNINLIKYTLIVLENNLGFSSFDKEIILNITKQDLSIINMDLVSIKDYIKGNIDLNKLKLFYLELNIQDDNVKINFKPSFIKYYIRKHYGEEFNSIFINDYNTDKTFDENLYLKLSDYLNKDTEMLSDMFDIPIKSKSINNILFNKMINGQKGLVQEELSKANIIIKTLNFTETGRLAESMSFPAFKYEEIILEEWETSKIKRYFENTMFLFVVYEQRDNKTIFVGTKFWKMDYKTLNDEVKRIWCDTKIKISKGMIVREVKNGIRYTHFSGIRDSDVLHVRPHARDKYDVFKLPVRDLLTGVEEYMKHCFWLNNTYISQIINPTYFYDNHKPQLGSKSATENPSKKTVQRKKFRNNIYMNETDNNYVINLDDLIQEVLKKQFYVETNISEDYKNKIILLTKKNILIKMSNKMYLTVKVLMDHDISFKDSTYIFSLISKIKNGSVINMLEITKYIKDSELLNQFIKRVRINKFKYKNKIYLTNIFKFTYGDYAELILSIEKSLNTKDLLESMSEILGNNFSEVQLKNAIKNRSIHYDSDFNKYYINKNQFLQELWGK